MTAGFTPFDFSLKNPDLFNVIINKIPDEILYYHSFPGSFIQKAFNNKETKKEIIIAITKKFLN